MFYGGKSPDSENQLVYTGQLGLDSCPFQQKNESVLFCSDLSFQKGRFPTMKKAWSQKISGVSPPAPHISFPTVRRHGNKIHLPSKAMLSVNLLQYFPHLRIRKSVQRLFVIQQVLAFPTHGSSRPETPKNFF